MNCLLHVTSSVVNGRRRGCEEARTNCDVMEDEHDFGDMQVVEEARPIPARGRPRCIAGGETKVKLDLWICDTSLSTEDMAFDYGFHRNFAHAKLLTRQREEMKETEEAATLEGSEDAAAGGEPARSAIQNMCKLARCLGHTPASW